MTADELRRAQDEAIAQVGDRQLVPEPGGLAGRVARAHDEGRAALAEGDLDGAIGSEIPAPTR